MNLLTEQELSKLSTKTSRDLAQRWQGMERKLSGKDGVTIANTGLVNSGKSSLFNALLDRNDGTERFPVGPVRTTKHGDREHLLDWLDILDTPGIDATEEDDDVAYQTLMEADLIVATHNIKMGMLNKSEYEWFSHLAEKMQKEEIQQRIIFVCTWIDEREKDAEAYQNALDETYRQVTQALGAEVPFWTVSAKRYMTAKQKDNANLESASNIPQFKKFLLERGEEIRKTAQAQRLQQLRNLCQETRRTLQKERKGLSDSIEAKRRAVQRNYAPAYQSWTSILKNFKSKRSAVESKIESLKAEDILPGVYTALFNKNNQTDSCTEFINKIYEI
jgi:tRNA U34 5-carboxymethylaminomethyl modifying GTPase MnmE/TrmE